MNHYLIDKGVPMIIKPAVPQGDEEKVMSLVGVRELVDEIESLRAKLQPSPCGVDRHLMVDWVPHNNEQHVNGPYKAAEPCICGGGYCLACQRERAEYERGRKEAK